MRILIQKLNLKKTFLSKHNAKFQAIHFKIAVADYMKTKK